MTPESRRWTLSSGGIRRALELRAPRLLPLEKALPLGLLAADAEGVHSWQLIRGVLATHATGGSFCVFCDGRRPDLIDRWFKVMRAVSDGGLRTRLGILTWQEIAATLPKPVRIFLDEKYGI